MVQKMKLACRFEADWIKMSKTYTVVHVFSKKVQKLYPDGFII